MWMESHVRTAEHAARRHRSSMHLSLHWHVHMCTNNTGAGKHNMVYTKMVLPQSTEAKSRVRTDIRGIAELLHIRQPSVCHGNGMWQQRYLCTIECTHLGWRGLRTCLRRPNWAAPRSPPHGEHRSVREGREGRGGWEERGGRVSQSEGEGREWGSEGVGRNQSRCTYNFVSGQQEWQRSQTERRQCS